MRHENRKPLSTRDRIAEEARLASDRHDRRVDPESEPTATPVADRPLPPEERDATVPIEHRHATSEPHEGHGAERHAMVFPPEETTGYRSRWEAIQTGFVDEPRAAVEQADELVAQVVTRLSEMFTRERQTLEQQWARGDDVSTEDLRVAFKRYRTFFDRLLSM